MAFQNARMLTTDERIAKTGPIRRVFRWVEAGALIGAIVVWAFFALVAPETGCQSRAWLVSLIRPQHWALWRSRSPCS